MIGDRLLDDIAREDFAYIRIFDIFEVASRNAASHDGHKARMQKLAFAGFAASAFDAVALIRRQMPPLLARH